MDCEESVIKIGRNLEKIANGQSGVSALDLLNALKKLPITLEILQRTRIGMTVNTLRKSVSDEETTNLAKQLIKLWKKLLDGKSNAKASTNGNISPANSEDTNDPTGLKRISSVASSLSNQESQDAMDRSSKVAAVKKSASVPAAASKMLVTSDEVRLKCREMIFSSLKTGELPDGTLDPEDIAARVESAIFEAQKRTGEKYKACVRSRVFNLRDKKNPDLRLNVLTGAISGQRLATMTSEQMASSEMNNLRQKFTKEAINDHQMAVNQGTATDMFKCGKCGGHRCTYTQLQTRSSDEPMTTFVFCSSCGNRWKFC